MYVEFDINDLKLYFKINTSVKSPTLETKDTICCYTLFSSKIRKLFRSDVITIGQDCRKEVIIKSIVDYSDAQNYYFRLASIDHVYYLVQYCQTNNYQTQKKYCNCRLDQV